MALCLTAVLTACGTVPPPPELATPPQGEAVTEVVEEHLYTFYDQLESPSAIYVAKVANAGSVPIEITQASVTLRSRSGEVLNTAAFASVYPSRINPQESAYICESLLQLGSAASLADVGEASLQLVATVAAEVPSLGIEVSQLRLRHSGNMLVASGVAKNTTGEEYRQVMFYMPIHTADGSLLTLAVGYLDALAAGESAPFEQVLMWVDPHTDLAGLTLMAIPRLLYPN